MLAPSQPSIADQSKLGLSRLGLGTWAFGAVGWGAQDDRDSTAAIHRAVELGVNWIDTAAVYGNGHAERLVGAALADLDAGERPLVFTKGGVLVHRTNGRTHRDLTPQSLRAECEASIRRLGTEHIDLYQLHWPVDDVGAVERGWLTLEELKREGKIRWAGVSNFDVPLLDRCAALSHVDAVQMPLSLLSRESARDVLPWTTTAKAHVLVYSPLESGLLSGRFTEQRLDCLPETDWRSRRAQFQQPQVTRTWRLLTQLQPIAANLGVSIAELAIAWTLSWIPVGGTIVGARSAAQVDGWAKTAGFTLDDEVLDKIETVLRATEAGVGPTRPPAAH